MQDSQLEAAQAFQKTTLASRVGARLKDGRERYIAPLAQNTDPVPGFEGRAPTVPVTPGVNLTGRGMKAEAERALRIGNLASPASLHSVNGKSTKF